MNGTYTLHLKDQNGFYQSGKTVTVKKTGLSTEYSIAEVTGSPGVYSSSSIPMGFWYDVYVDGIIMDSQYQNIPFGFGVENDPLFYAEHDPDTGEHTDISVTSITWR